MSAATPVLLPVDQGSTQKTHVKQASNSTEKQLNVSAPQNNEGATQEQIAKLAYSLWERRGRVEGSPEKDWFEAEGQLLETVKA